MEEVTLEIDLPGFRFHPTEEELLDFYLRSVASGKKLRFDVIGILNIYRHDPWDLPDLSKAGEREWYFFVPRDRKHGNGGRPNRTTAKGFWKATDSDRTVISVSEPKRVIGLKKTLVFYMGRAPRGSKTDWIMNEYRLPDSCPLPKDLVLCKVYRKATSLKVLEQRAISEGERKVTMTQQDTCHTSPPSPMSTETVSFSRQKQEDDPFGSICVPHLEFKKEAEEEEEVVVNLEENKVEGAKEKKGTSTSIQMPLGIEPLAELQVPKVPTTEWDQDPFGAQFTSPWLLNWVHHYANVLNFHV